MHRYVKARRCRLNVEIVYFSLLLVVLVKSGVACEPSDAESANIKGAWKVRRWSTDGKDTDKMNYQGLEILADDTTFLMPGLGAAGYVIRSTGGNLELDFFPLEGSRKDVTCRMLARKESNKLKLCYSLRNMKIRPDQVAPGKDLDYIEAIQVEK